MQIIKIILPQTSYNEKNQPLVVEYEYGIVFSWIKDKTPKFPSPKVRNFDYCLYTNNCYTWAYWAKRKALEVMFVVPSL